MFENSGEKIVKVAKVLFWISVISSVILAFVFGFSKEYHSFHSVYFFSLLIGYPLFSYISTLFYVAFGELVQNSQKIKETIAENNAEAKTETNEENIVEAKTETNEENIAEAKTE